jgi:hypothetical protein
MMRTWRSFSGPLVVPLEVPVVLVIAVNSELYCPLEQVVKLDSQMELRDGLAG